MTMIRIFQISFLKIQRMILMLKDPIIKGKTKRIKSIKISNKKPNHKDKFKDKSNLCSKSVNSMRSLNLL